MRYLSLIVIMVLGAAGSAPAAELPVFPGAKGFGTTTVAGSGRHLTPPQTRVFKVTSLADSGKGSLREAVQSDMPRTVVFEVGGEILLKSPLRIRHPYLTIAGQSAPEPGITLRGAGLQLESHDILVQHLRIRIGDDPDGPPAGARDGVSVFGKEAHDIVVDHVSVSWSVDELVGMGRGCSRITFSRCIFAEALRHSIHPEGPHSMAMLVGPGSKEITVQGSLFAHNGERNPRAQAGATLEFLNNVVYNWERPANFADSGKDGGAIACNFAGNFFKAGKNSLPQPVLGGKAHPDTRIFVEKNFSPARNRAALDEWSISGLPNAHRALKPVFPPSGVITTDPQESYEQALKRSGARPGTRDAVDRRLIDEVTRGTGSIKDTVRDAGGWPEMKETTRALELPAERLSPDGYTALEKLLHTRAAEVEKAER